MRATIHPIENAVRIDDELLVINNVPWPGPALPDFVENGRPIEVIHFDGAVGVIQRRSRAPGKTDIEHFVGPDPIRPYVDLHAAEKKRLADEKAARDKAVEETTRRIAELTEEQAEDDRLARARKQVEESTRFAEAAAQAAESARQAAAEAAAEVAADRKRRANVVNKA
jgi:hypothetical protein